MSTYAFALAGRVVSKSRDAWRIYHEAIADGRDWIVPQARNVAIMLRRHERAAIVKSKGAAA